MKEDELKRIWQERAWSAPLITADGQTLEVISTGMPGEAAGPDFRGAMLLLDGYGPLTGDVELHVRSSDWGGHGHNKDPAYNGVKLHVVWEQAVGNTALLQNGGPITTLVLSKAQGLVTSPPCLDAASTVKDIELLEALGRAGESRFRLKGKNILKSMEEYPPLEVLYQGIMEALGYSANSKIFEQLALRLPLATLLEYGTRVETAYIASAFQGILLGTAGLIPEGLHEAIEHERAWREFLKEQEDVSCAVDTDRAAGDDKNLDWDLKVRPANSPVRRLAGAGALFARWKACSEPCRTRETIEYLITLLFDGSNKPIDKLEKSLEVKAAGYWSAHWDFGRPLQGAAPALIGRGRARVIVVNIILPFLWAFGTAKGRPELARMALDAFADCPKSEDDRIIRHMEGKLGVKGRASKGLRAVHQAGMHQIYRHMCMYGKCEGCPIYMALENRLPSP